MADFDWRTEEEEDVVTTRTRMVLRRSGRRLWILAILATLTILLVAVTLWRLNQRIESETQQVENDILAAFHTWRQAVTRSDEDILNTILIGNRTQWMMAQRHLLETGRILDRTMLGLPPASDLDGIVPDIDLAQDWLSAELTFELPYGAEDNRQPSSIVRLEHSVNFKREGSRWLLAEREQDYWGEWQTEEGSLISFTYREGDSNHVKRLVADLERELKFHCHQVLIGSDCPEDAHVRIRFESDPVILLQVIDQGFPIISGRAFVLPTPTLVGIPADDNSYQSLFPGYTRPIVEAFSANLDSPIPLPEQEVQILCFSESTNRQSLFSYDAINDRWTAELPGRSFRYLSPMVDDQGLVLLERLRGSGPNQLRVIGWQDGQDSILADEEHGLLMNPIGWAGSVGHPELLLHSYETSVVNSVYSRIPTQGCPLAGCSIEDMDGFAVWSPDGQQTLVVLSENVHLGDANGKILAPLGQGFSPFWMSNQRYGFVRYVESGDELMVEILARQIGQPEQNVILDSDGLAKLVGRRDVGVLFVNFVATRPDDPNTIFFTARTYNGNQSNFYLFSVRIEERPGEGFNRLVGADPKLHLELDQPPSGFPSPLSPNGYVPFILSPDGRWVSLAVRGETIGESWTVFNLDLERGGIKTMQISYPLSTFIHPFLDWSGDGQWLISVEKSFLRMTAPEYNYSRLIFHELHACSHVAWIN